MFGFEEIKKANEIAEMLDQVEKIFSDLRVEYLEMAKKYDDAAKKAGELEEDKRELLDSLTGREVFRR